LEQARVDLDRRRLTAPFSGRVGITEIDVGDRIDTNTLVTTIDDRSVLLVNFSVPEVYVDKVTRGTPVEVSLWDAADRPVSGEIVAVDSRIDINSRSFIARAAIDNASDRFRPGMAFEISLNATRGAFLSVPDVAVQWGADGAYVWVAEDGRAARREVRLVKRLSGAILIEGNVQAGEPVVMEGVQAVRAGASLKVLSVNELDGTAQSTRSPETTAVNG
jgi:RND family efflux transporter MFP subunit